MPTPKSKTTKKPAATAPSAHILLVEDERRIADLILRGLKKAGYAVDTASDGEKGHALASAGKYDLLILDWMLPKLDGVSLCSQLRDEKCNVPVLMLTARDSVKDKVAGLEAGAQDYLTKPFAITELLARVKGLLGRRDSAPAGKLKVADLEMDLETNKVTRGGKELNLTSKEAALLEFLLRNQGRIVTRTMISEQVWDLHVDSFTNVIDVYINYLRNKVDKSFSKKLIHTLRGRGYILRT